MTSQTNPSSVEPAGAQPVPFAIDLFHDTVCPWCRIGYTNLRRALEQWDGPEVSIRLRPFQLDPTTPREGVDWREYIRAKFGGNQDAIFARVAQAGAAAGLTFNFDAIKRQPNTILSHALFTLVPEDARDDVLERTYRAHFEEGRDIGDMNVLLQIAEEAGLDTTEIAKGLAREDLLDVVRQAAEAAREMGVTGVPLFIIDNTLAVSGGQPPEVLLAAMRRALAMRDGERGVSLPVV